MADVLFDAAGTIELGVQAGLTTESVMSASCAVAVAGSAWMTTTAGPGCAMSARCTIALRPRWTRALHDGDTLPATDGYGWTAPDVTPPDIREDA